MKLRTIADWEKSELKGKRVFVRVDMNVPFSGGTVADDWRIETAIPTIRFLRRAGAKVVIATHIGRPDGRRVAALSTKPVARRLAVLLGAPVRHVEGSIGPAVARAVAKLRPRDILFLENLRFHPGEDAADPAFARALAALADRYVNDAFASSHRASASISLFPRYLPSAAGFLLMQEVTALSRLLHAPKKPFFVLIGGVKIDTKIGVIRALAKRATTLAIGGALALPFLKAKGLPVGARPIPPAEVRIAKRLLALGNILLPEDAVVARRPDDRPSVRSIASIGPLESVYDIGPATVRRYAAEIRRAHTIVWNGPVGYFEKKRFSHGTSSIALAIASRSRGRAFGVVGGGETVEAVRGARLEDSLDWVSTGGGAMLEMLEGKALPGIAALSGPQKTI